MASPSFLAVIFQRFQCRFHCFLRVYRFVWESSVAIHEHFVNFLCLCCDMPSVTALCGTLSGQLSGISLPHLHSTPSPLHFLTGIT